MPLGLVTSLKPLHESLITQTKVMSILAYQVLTAVPPAFTMSAKAAFIFAVLRPVRPIQYALPPTTVNLAPLSKNFVPETVTNPVEEGGGVTVGDGGLDVGTVGIEVAGMEVVGAGGAEPFKHWEYQSF